MPKRLPSEGQILTEIPARSHRQRWHWVVLGLAMILLLMVGGYYALRMTMTMPGDGGAELQQQ